MRKIPNGPLSLVIAAGSLVALSACGGGQADAQSGAASPSQPSASASSASSTASSSPPSSQPPAAPARASQTSSPSSGAAKAAHPAYLHALADLRDARANLEKKGGDGKAKWDEHEGVAAIDKAIKEIKEAAIDDGRNIDEHVAVDAKEPRKGRLHKALDALKQAKKDVSLEEDNAFANGLRNRALHHIEEAIRLTEAGVKAAEDGI
jgi:hypothetical protein